MSQATSTQGYAMTNQSVLRKVSLTAGLMTLLMATAGQSIASSQSNEASTLGKAFSEGKPSLQFRYRVENVDQQGLLDNALASTLKTTLSYQTLPYKNFSFLAELDNVSYLGNEQFNNTRNGNTKYPVVADPDGTDVNQLYLNLDTSKGHFRLGRQRINLDNQRFVGGVGWRQNEQTYDAVTFNGKVFTSSKFHYGYIARVSRIFGPDSGTPPDDLDSEIHFFTFETAFANKAVLAVYAHQMDFDDAPGFSNSTLGASFKHTWALDEVNEIKVPLHLEYASQQDEADNPVSYRSGYYLIETGVDTKTWGFRVGMETLEGSTSPGEAFRTPLATLHKFQGWADKFLTTPHSGVRDIYLTGKYKSFTLTLHDFDGDRGAGQLGREMDVSWSQKINNKVNLLLKYADYRADGFATDTTKLWAMVTVKL